MGVTLPTLDILGTVTYTRVVAVDAALRKQKILPGPYMRHQHVAGAFLPNSASPHLFYCGNRNSLCFKRYEKEASLF